MSQMFCPKCQATVAVDDGPGGVPTCTRCYAKITADRRNYVTPAFAPRAVATEAEPTKPHWVWNFLTIRWGVTFALGLVVLGAAVIILNRESPEEAFEKIQNAALAGKWVPVWGRIEKTSQTRVLKSLAELRTFTVAEAKEKKDTETADAFEGYGLGAPLFAGTLSYYEHSRNLLFPKRYIRSVEDEGDGVLLNLATTPDGPPTEFLKMVREDGVWKMSFSIDDAAKFGTKPPAPPPPPPPPPPRGEGLDTWMAVGDVEVAISQVAIEPMKLHSPDNFVLPATNKAKVLLVELKIRIKDKPKELTEKTPYRPWQQKYDSVAKLMDPDTKADKTAYKRPTDFRLRYTPQKPGSDPVDTIGPLVGSVEKPTAVVAGEPLYDLLAFTPPPGDDVDYLDLDLPAANVFPRSQELAREKDIFRFRIPKKNWTSGPFFKWRPKKEPVIEAPPDPELIALSPREWFDPLAGGYQRYYVKDGADPRPEPRGGPPKGDVAFERKLNPSDIYFIEGTKENPVILAIDGQTLSVYQTSDAVYKKALTDAKKVFLVESFSGTRSSKSGVAGVSWVNIVSGPHAGKEFALPLGKLVTILPVVAVKTAPGKSAPADLATEKPPTKTREFPNAPPDPVAVTPDPPAEKPPEKTPEKPPEKPPAKPPARP